MRHSTNWKYTGILLPLSLRAAIEGLAARQQATLSDTVRNILIDAVVRDLDASR